MIRSRTAAALHAVIIQLFIEGPPIGFPGYGIPLI